MGNGVAEAHVEVEVIGHCQHLRDGRPFEAVGQNTREPAGRGGLRWAVEREMNVPVKDISREEECGLTLRHPL